MTDDPVTTSAATVEVEWCDEANGAYIVVCSTHGVVDHAPTEAEAEDRAADHRLADEPATAAALARRSPFTQPQWQAALDVLGDRADDLLPTVERIVAGAPWEPLSAVQALVEFMEATSGTQTRHWSEADDVS